jgi:histidinol-phosphate aminotransferase
MLALAALDSTEYYESIGRQMREDRQAYRNLFAGFKGFRCFASDANFVLVRIPPELKGPLQTFLGEKRIVIKFFSEPSFVDCVRITLGTKEQNHRLQSALREFMEARRAGEGPA